jgi:hypothetical protein
MDQLSPSARRAVLDPADDLDAEIERGEPAPARALCPHCPHPWHGLFCRPYSDTPTCMCWCRSSFPGRVA